MRTQRLNMMVVLVTVSMTAGFAGCRYHGHGFVVHQLGAACDEFSKSDHTSHTVGPTPDYRHFSVTPNAAPPSQSSKGVLTSAHLSNRDSGESPLLVPQPSALVPVVEPNFQLLPRNPLKLPAETRSPFFLGQRAALNLIPVPGSKRHPHSKRRSDSVFEPVESQQRLVPRATHPNGMIQKIQSGIIKLFPKKQLRNSSTASVAKSSRRSQSLSRHKRPKGQVSQKRLGKKRAASRVAASRISTGNDRTNHRNTLVRAQHKNPVLLQVPQPIP